MDIVGDRKFVEVPGEKTHELPPLLVRTSPNVRRLDRVVGMANNLIESEDMMPPPAFDSPAGDFEADLRNGPNDDPRRSGCAIDEMGVRVLRFDAVKQFVRNNLQLSIQDGLPGYANRTGAGKGRIRHNVCSIIAKGRSA